MQEFPYLFGQLLRISDDLHQIYCKIMRNNDMPNTLVGGGLYIMGAEQPSKALGVLGQRMNPYLMWAKKYQTKNVTIESEESWRVAGYLSAYDTVASKISPLLGRETRFNDNEKAQYCIGYLAMYPGEWGLKGKRKKEIAEENIDTN